MIYEYIINPKGKEGWRAINSLNGVNVWFMMQPQVVLNEGEPDEIIFRNHQDIIYFLDANVDKRQEFAELLSGNANTAYSVFATNNNIDYN